MPPYAIADVDVPTDGAPTAEIRELHRLDQREMLDFFGHDDLVGTPESMTTHFLSRATNDRWWLTARDDTGALVGGAAATLPLRDNTSLVELELNVDPAADHAEVLGALWDTIAPRIRAAGRSSVHLWQMHRPTDASLPEAVLPSTRVGAVAADVWTRTLQDLGFSLEQVERHSTLDVAAHRDDWPSLAAEALERASGYEVITWFGRTPEEFLPGMAVLNNRMSVDVPQGGLAYEEEAWDADRILDKDERAEEAGEPRLTTVARHRGSGQLVAYTELTLPESKPAVAWQGDTLVHGEHRGHRLGLLVKTANLAAVLERRPSTERIHTWNADENQWMLAINVALGFAPASAEGAWRIDLS